MRNPVKRLAAVLFVLGCTPFVHAAPQATSPKIQSVEGAKTVLLQDGISLREVTVGDVVDAGERIRTDAKTKVNLIYPDGSKVVIFPGTDFEIQKTGKDRVVQSELKSGTVQGVIAKAPGGAPDPAAATSVSSNPPKKPIKFVIRTKTAVMGVRGTDFVAAYNALSNLAQFNTLEGAVEVATQPAQLMGGQGVAVGTGQFVQAAEQGLSTVQPFNTTGFLGNLNSATSAAAASTGSSAGGLIAGGAGAVANSAATSAAVAAAKPSNSAAPAAQPAPAPKPPEAAPATPPPAVVAQQKADDEAERPRMHLASFSFGAFHSRDPRPEVASDRGAIHNALVVAWTPTIPIPVLNFLYLRGSFGPALFDRFSLRNALFLHEYWAFVGTTLLKPVYFEVGAGEQIWRFSDADGGAIGGNAGLIISMNGRLNRIFIGASKFFKGNDPFQARAGIGIQLF